jgi:hypothetical protein
MAHDKINLAEKLATLSEHEEVHLLLIEPTGTPNTGDPRTPAPRTVI